MSFKLKDPSRRIYLCRIEKNLSRQYLADCLNVTERTIGNWESGKTALNITQINKVAEVLEVSPLHLVDVPSLD
jgi:transcriptional regulator with XRE-family HTH domain